MSNEVISFKNLTKHYGSSTGVSNIDLVIEPGEIFGFLGPNGAGKTTTIRMMLDLLRPSSGEIKIFGKNIKEESLFIRNKIGYLQGNFTSFDDITGNEFLRLVNSLRHISYKSPRRLFDRFELTSNDLNKKMNQLSHGMLQKLGIIQAVMHKPELLILDEPTIGLDPLMQEEFYKLLLELNKNGCTIFFSSHNLSEVERVCEKVAIIRKGEIVALETIENLKRKIYRKFKLVLKYPVSDFHFSNTELVYHKDLTYEFMLKGNIQTLLKELNKLPVKNFVLPEPNLEEVFRSFYKENKNE